MFDFDAGKLLIIGVIALLVIGPKDLPRVLRQVGQWTGKMRRMANEFRGQFMDAMREADFETIKKEVDAAAASATIHADFDPVGDVNREIKSAIDTNPDAAMAGVDAPPVPAPVAEPAAESAVSALPAESNIPRYLLGQVPDSLYQAGTAGVLHVQKPVEGNGLDEAGMDGIVIPPLARPDEAKKRRVAPRLYKSSRADAIAAIASKNTSRARDIAVNAVQRRPVPAAGNHAESVAKGQG